MYGQRKSSQQHMTLIMHVRFPQRSNSVETVKKNHHKHINKEILILGVRIAGMKGI
jgi:hypothetical protein